MRIKLLSKTDGRQRGEALRRRPLPALGQLSSYEVRGLQAELEFSLSDKGAPHRAGVSDAAAPSSLALFSAREIKSSECKATP